MTEYALEYRWADDDTQDWCAVHDEPRTIEQLLELINRRFSSQSMLTQFEYRIVKVTYEETRTPL